MLSEAKHLCSPLKANAEILRCAQDDMPGTRPAKGWKPQVPTRNLGPGCPVRASQFWVSKG